MKYWIILAATCMGVGLFLYFNFTEDRLLAFLAGYLVGAGLGALLMRVLFNNWLRPEFFEKKRGGNDVS